MNSLNSASAANKKEKIIVTQYNTIKVLKAKRKQHYRHVITWKKSTKITAMLLFSVSLGTLTVSRSAL